MRESQNARDPAGSRGLEAVPEFAGRHAFREQEAVWAEFLAMGQGVVESLEKGVAALCEGGIDVVPEVNALERDSDREEVRIEQNCLRVLALFEPVASDLRRMATILKVSRDWERIADLAARIARRSRKLAGGSELVVPIPESLKSLGRDVLDEARASYLALAERDSQRARAVIDGERTINRLYRQFRRGAKDALRRDAAQLDAWLQLMSIGRHLQRIADLARDIAETVVYLEEGVIIRHNLDTQGAKE